MTPAQLTTLNNDIAADPVLGQLPHGPDQAFAIAEAYNAQASPTFVVWRTDVSVDEIMRNGFDWTRVDNLSVGKARIWEWMTQFGTINAAQANIRAGIDATWVGTAADLAVRAAVYVHCRRPAKRAEKLFATGTGSDASPATMTFEGDVTMQDVQDAWNQGA